MSCVTSLLLLQPLQELAELPQILVAEAPFLDQVPYQWPACRREQTLNQIVDRLPDHGSRLDAGRIDVDPPLQSCQDVTFASKRRK